MQDFFFHAPETLEEVFSLFQEYGENARPIAGGTALVVMMKQSLVQADHLVSLQRVNDLRSIVAGDGDLHIGALVTHREVEISELVRERVPLVADVYSRVATVRIRNVATVGGGLAHADPSQDPPPGLIASDARVRLLSSQGERVIPVEELFRDYYESSIQVGEVLTELIIPLPSSRRRTVYLKYLPRTADDYPTVGVAATAQVEDGLCKEIRVALGAVAPTPIRAKVVEEVLEGREATPQMIRLAAESVADQVDPLTDIRGSAEYKRDMAVVFTRRALEAILKVTP
jgi:carbon-monoxide dehydrogenase medium subunit